MSQGSLFAAGIERTAAISDGGEYRYRLGRIWGDGPACNFIMLNPSVADSTIDDPTARRCIEFTRRWGYGRLIVTNLFALRSTDPEALRTAADPIGPENDHLIVQAAVEADLVVCAWGSHPFAVKRAADVLAMLRKAGITPHCLALTQSGAPGHPLYLKADRRPVPMTEGGAH